MYTRKREYMRDTSFPSDLHCVSISRKRCLLPKGSPLDTRQRVANKRLSTDHHWTRYGDQPNDNYDPAHGVQEGGERNGS